MPKRQRAATPSEQQKEEVPRKECFVIMPTVDIDGYPPGHFQRVYDGIIKQACEAAGFRAVRAIDRASSKNAVADTLNSLVNAEIVLCDVSGLHPDVMYELGLRQSYGMPVALIKDNRTGPVSDITGLQDVKYDASLREDLLARDVLQIAMMITHQHGNGTTGPLHDKPTAADRNIR